MQKYKITRKFLAGSCLEGLTYTEITTVYMAVGFTPKNPIGNAPYTIISCEKVN